GAGLSPLALGLANRLHLRRKSLAAVTLDRRALREQTPAGVGGRLVHALQTPPPQGCWPVDTSQRVQQRPHARRRRPLRTIMRTDSVVIRPLHPKRLTVGKPRASGHFFSSLGLVFSSAFQKSRNSSAPGGTLSRCMNTRP